MLTRYIESQVYQGVVENIACEQAARMVAMKNATDNAGELIEELQLAYNKADKLRLHKNYRKLSLVQQQFKKVYHASAGCMTISDAEIDFLTNKLTLLSNKLG